MASRWGSARALLRAAACLGAGVALFSATPPQAPIPPAAEGVFRSVQSLAPGARVLLSLDFGPATAAENRPEADAILRHLLARRVRVALMSLWPAGPPEIRGALDRVARREFPGLAEGEDYVNLGFKTGRGGAIRALATDFRGLFASDAEGAALDGFGLFDGVTRLADFNLVIAVGSGSPGGADWVRYGRTPRKVAIALAATAAQAPQLFAYWPSQVAGLLVGLRDTAAYEEAVARARGIANPLPGASRLLPAQSAVLIALLALALREPARPAAPERAR